MDQPDLKSTGVVEVHIPPAMCRRRAEIQQFLASLSNHEVRAVTAQLSKRTLETDIVARVPHEIRLQIAEHLDAGDVINLYNVSRRWRSIWREERAVKMLARKYLPGLLPYLAMKKELDANQDQNMPQLFHKTMLRQNMTRLGKFRSVLWVDLKDPMPIAFRLDPTFHTDTNEVAVHGEIAVAIAASCTSGPTQRSYAGAHRYHDGRHAWTHERGSSHIIVDDLRSQLRRMYSAPAMHGGDIQLLALGDQLLVARCGRRVYAFNLTTGAHDAFIAPNSTVEARTHRDTVCLICQETITLWSFGGGRSTTLDLGHLQPHRQQSVDILFHPLRENVVFIYQKPVTPTNGYYHIQVAEYHDGIFAKLHDFLDPEVYKDDIAGAWGTRRINGTRRQPPTISPYGDYVLFEQKLSRKLVERPGISVPHDGMQNLVCFNVLTGAFTKRAFTWPLEFFADPLDELYLLPWVMRGNPMSKWHFHVIHRWHPGAVMGVIGNPEGERSDWLHAVAHKGSEAPAWQVRHHRSLRGRWDTEVWADEEFTVLRVDNRLTIWSIFSELKPLSSV